MMRALRLNLVWSGEKMTEITQKILEEANKAYHNGECRIDEDIPAIERGDGLASFIRQEIIEVTEGEQDKEETLSAARRVMIRAVEEVLDVWIALDELEVI